MNILKRAVKLFHRFTVRQEIILEEGLRFLERRYDGVVEYIITISPRKRLPVYIFFETLINFFKETRGVDVVRNSFERHFQLIGCPSSDKMCSPSGIVDGLQEIILYIPPSHFWDNIVYWDRVARDLWKLFGKYP